MTFAKEQEKKKTKKVKGEETKQDDNLPKNAEEMSREEIIAAYI